MTRHPSSIEEEMEDGGSKKKKGRNRSNSNAGETPKKAHPRSKEATTTIEDEEPAPLACRSQFFQDKCAEKKGCRYIHYNDPFKTIATIVKTTTDLQAAEAAAVDALPIEWLETEPNAMELLHYICLDATSSATTSLSEDIYNQLSQNYIKMADLVYVVVNESLIYDRCREGVVLNEREMLFAIQGPEELGKRRISVGSEGEVAGILTKLPGSILEHTLTFLPDSAVTACCMVCKDWHNEIGKASPHLWRHLLERRRWPFPEGPDQSQEAFRKIFMEHYSAMRNVNAIKLGISALTTRKLHPEREMCYQDFSARKQAPSEPNACISVQVWSPNRILAAYSQDCSIRLFEAVPKNGDEKLCKELVCQWFNPHRRTKRRRCTLLSMVLDDECIGSLCHVSADGEDAEADILVVANREEFLLGESSAAFEKGGHLEDLNLHVIDVGEATINYLLSTDTADHRLLQLMDFLQDGGEMSEVEILASRTMTSCGNGRFMVEVCISIPSEDDDEGDEERPMRLVDRKLVLFSASVGAIVWIGDSGDPLADPQPRGLEATITELRWTLPGDYRPTSNVLVASSFSSHLWLISVDPTGSVKHPVLLEGSLPMGTEIRTDGWRMFAKPQRHILLTENYAIAVDLLQKHSEEGVFERKSVLSFYPLQQPAALGALFHTLELHRIEILRMIILQDSHIGLICREYEDFIQVDMNEGIRMSLLPQSACLILVHIPSRTEIYRTPVGCIESFREDMSDVPILSVYSSTTIGCALDWRGVSISGDDVRQIKLSYLEAETSQLNSAKKKKKKQGGTAKGRRKDGFARGMSLRG